MRSCAPSTLGRRAALKAGRRRRHSLVLLSASPPLLNPSSATLCAVSTHAQLRSQLPERPTPLLPPPLVRPASPRQPCWLPGAQPRCQGLPVRLGARPAASQPTRALHSSPCSPLLLAERPARPPQPACASLQQQPQPPARAQCRLRTSGVTAAARRRSSSDRRSPAATDDSVHTPALTTLPAALLPSAAGRRLRPHNNSQRLCLATPNQS